MIRRRAHRFALAISLAALGGLVPLEASAQWPPPGQPTQSGQAGPTDPSGQPIGGQPAQPPSPYDPSMQAGGLAPPPPMDPNADQKPSKPPEDTTQRDLDDAKKKDSKRGLSFFWLNAEGGYEYVDLQTFNIDEKAFTAGFIQTKEQGPVVGAGIGAQLLFLTIGARGRVGFFKDWQLFSVGGELGFRFPVGKLEPHIDLGGGYEAIGNAQGALQGAVDAISIRGFYLRAGGGLDYYPTSILSIGANASAEFMALVRPGVSFDEISKIKNDPLATAVQRANADLLAAEGSGYGFSFAFTGVVGLHF